MTERQIEGDSQTVSDVFHGAASTEPATEAGVPTPPATAVTRGEGGVSTTGPLMNDDNPRTEREHHDR
jgi:hypothetical protein